MTSAAPPSFERLRFTALVALLVLVSLSACRSNEQERVAQAAAPRPSAAFPLRMRDDSGRTVVLEREPLRVVTLLPSFSETVYALGAGNKLVGVDDFSDYPPELAHLPKLGGAYDTRVEPLLALAPDLVLLADDSRALAQLTRHGVAVWGGSPRKLADVFRVIEAVGALLGRAREAQALNDGMQREIREIESQVARVERKSVYYELDSTPYSVGPESFIGALIEKAGGRNIVPPSLGDFPKLSPELVLSADPEVILGVSTEELRARPGWASLTAVKRGHAHAFPAAEAHLLSRPGPRLAAALRILVRQLHPELG